MTYNVFGVLVYSTAFLYVHSWRSILGIRETLSLLLTKMTQSTCFKLVHHWFRLSLLLVLIGVLQAFY